MNVRSQILAPMVWTACLGFGSSLPLLRAQGPATARLSYGTPRVELFLGYSRFGVGFNSNNGTTGNRMVGLNGGDASLAYNFTPHFALVGDFGGYDNTQLQLTGTGVNQPRTVDANGNAFTYMGGPRLTFGKQKRLSVFAQALAGGVHASAVTVTNCVGAACTPLPAQNAFALVGGGGVDLRLTHHLALRPVQVEYMMTRFSLVPSGGSASQNDLRLSTGIVLRFGGKVTPAAVPPPPVAAPVVVVAPPPPPPMIPPTISCDSDPQSILAGATSAITAHATGTHPGSLKYGYSASAGTVTGDSNVASLNSGGASPGTITVTCRVTDDLGQTASATTSVVVSAPPAPPVPQRSTLCTVSFERDHRRPVRVDNEAKACLDDIALVLQRTPTAKLVIIGSYAPGEKPERAEQRAQNEREYLTGEKGVDTQRIQLGAATPGDRSAANILLPDGATF